MQSADGLTNHAAVIYVAIRGIDDAFCDAA